MGTKVNRILFFFSVLFLCSNLSNAQLIKDTKSGYMKKYAYCHCVFVNNSKLDTSYLNDQFQIGDKSTNLLIDLGKISNSESEKIRQYTEKATENFTAFESEYYSEKGKSNTITAMCLDFYESKGLDGFIKKLIGIKNKKK